MNSIYRWFGRQWLGFELMPPYSADNLVSATLTVTLLLAALLYGCSQTAPTPTPVATKPPPLPPQQLTYVNVSGDLPPSQDQWMDSDTGKFGWCYDVTAFNSAGNESLPSSPATCRFAIDGRNIVSWTAPTENTDGSPLTNLAGFRVYRKSQ